eukprot:365696-Chlamydomonas_euryale.AAC.2
MLPASHHRPEVQWVWRVDVERERVEDGRCAGWGAGRLCGRHARRVGVASGIRQGAHATTSRGRGCARYDRHMRYSRLPIGELKTEELKTEIPPEKLTDCLMPHPGKKGNRDFRVEGSTGQLNRAWPPHCTCALPRPAS